jgi:hypothetical protein
MPALDLRRGRRTFRAVEDDSKRVTIYADDLKIRPSVMHEMRSIMTCHRLTQKINGGIRLQARLSAM